MTKNVKNNLTPAVFIVREADTIVGYAIILDKSDRVSRKQALTYPKLFELAAIWVDPGNRGNGEQSFAHHLREKCLVWAQKEGVWTIELYRVALG